MVVEAERIERLLFLFELGQRFVVAVPADHGLALQPRSLEARRFALQELRECVRLPCRRRRGSGEEVASRVPGVREVREELQVSGV